VLRGGLPELRGDVLAQLRRRDVAALLPLRTSERGDGGGGRPNEIVPPGPAASLSEQLDAVAEIDPAALVAAIAAADRAGHAASPWQPVAADPARWLRHYVQAVRRAWTALEPLWRRSAGVAPRPWPVCGKTAGRSRSRRRAFAREIGSSSRPEG